MGCRICYRDMKNDLITECDSIVIGSGMGGMTVAALFASDGLNPVVLEAAHVPGGCSSSFTRKGYTFESGATTLIGFDQHQPLHRLEQLTGIHIPRQKLTPSMTVHLDEFVVTRYQDREQWIREAIRVFGNPVGQRTFWELAYRVSDFVWKASERNTHFPPISPVDWIKMGLSNNPLDVPMLRFAFSSVEQVMNRFGVNSTAFKRFVDEQLMITAQSTSEHVPFLFGAAGLTYTNYSNYYVEGGLLEMIREIQRHIEDKGGQVLTRHKVTSIQRDGAYYLVETERKGVFRSRLVVSNIPTWNLATLCEGEWNQWFRKQSERYDQAWGAFTMGIVTKDSYPFDFTLHHQLHLDRPMSMTGADSLFVSMSARDDLKRAPKGYRTLNISCHTDTDGWFNLGEQRYDTVKEAVEQEIISILREKLPGFDASGVVERFGSTPVTWQNWVYRHKGRVGGIPQSMNRSLLDWTPAQSPYPGFYLCGDTIYPGQGIPGVTLGGINVYYRSKNYRESLRIKR